MHPEIMLRGIADKERGDWSEASNEELIQLAEKKAALVIGPGMGRFPQDSAWLRAIWEETKCPLVLDADALNMIADASDSATLDGGGVVALAQASMAGAAGLAKQIPPLTSPGAGLAAIVAAAQTV